MISGGHVQTSRAPRVPTSAQVHYTSPGMALRVVAHDVSVSGIFVPTESPDAPGTEADIELHCYLSPEPIVTKARVARAGHLPCRGMGLHFLELDDRRDRLLQRYTRQLTRPAARRVMMVDDDPALLRMMARLMEHEGNTFVGVDAPAATVERLKRFAPDVILLDVMMPGIDGFTLARRLRSDPALAAVPIMFFTASHEDPPAELADIPVLTKGCRRETLMRAIEEHAPVAVVSVAAPIRLR